MISKNILFLGFIGLPLVFASDWDYKSPENWVDDYPLCLNDKTTIQSPFDISTLGCKGVCMDNLCFTSGYMSRIQWTLKNNGHTLVATPSGSPPLMEFKSPIDKDVYSFVSFHWHWPSEYYLDGVQYGIGMHMVHKNKKYADVSEALNHEDGLLVLGFVYDSNRAESPALKQITDRISVRNPVLRNAGGMTTKKFSLSSFFEEANLEKFVSFKGSLTTPPCSPVVQWYFFTEPLEASEAQVEQLSRLRFSDGTKMVNNTRPLQNFNNRDMYCHAKEL